MAQSPHFSKTSGTFAEPFSLALSVTSPQAAVFYTVDGSEPTERSVEYVAPIPVSRSLEVRARAFEPNKTPSPIVNHVFLSLDQDLSDFSSNLPIVLLDTWGHGIPGTDSSSYAESRAVFIDTGSGGRAAVSDEVSHAGRAGIRIRGRSSAQFPKKQYKLETWDDRNDDEDVSLLGLPEESDWVLYGPYSDKALMRNYLAYRWWELLGHYSVRTRFCEVFLNDDHDGKMSYADDYVGVYLLTETIKIGQDRVDIAELTPQDNAEPGITGGYIIEMGNANPGGFASTISGQTVEFSYWDPEAGSLTSAQRQWVRDYIREFELTLYGPAFADPRDGYAAYTDVASQVDYEIMREFTRNFDGGSTFFYLDRNGKLTMGPLWDYNMAMGNANYAHNDEPGYYTSGWNDSHMAPGVNGWCPWWYRFRADPDYQQRLIDRWFELRRGLFSDVNILAEIQTATALLEHEAAARNFARWAVLGTYVWANPPGWQERRTYRSEIDWMKQWLLERAAWIDSQFVKPPRITLEKGVAGSQAVATLTCDGPAGAILYTLDGSDPRLFDGSEGVAPSAIQYSPAVPVLLDGSTVLKARTFRPAGTLSPWSGVATRAYDTNAPESSLRITEVMYHPVDPDPQDSIDREDYEFLEIANVGATAVNLGGLCFVEGIDFVFPDLALAPGRRVVLARNPAALRLHYTIMPAGTVVIGPFKGHLSNGGERLRWQDGGGTVIQDFSYDGSWCPLADGRGFSLTATDPYGTDGGQWSLRQSWRAGTVLGGSPGWDDSPIPGLP